MHDEEKNDNFLNDDELEPKTTATTPSPDDPFAPLQPATGPTVSPDTGNGRRFNLKRLWIWAAALVAAVLTIAIILRYFVPYVSEARVTGYITSVERRGLLIKTFEGEMITESSLTDTTRVYSRDFSFSVDNDSLARRLQDFQGTGRAVVVTYKRYYGMIPWRGASTCIVTDMRPADNQAIF